MRTITPSIVDVLFRGVKAVISVKASERPKHEDIAQVMHESGNVLTYGDEPMRNSRTLVSMLFAVVDVLIDVLKRDHGNDVFEVEEGVTSERVPINVGINVAENCKLVQQTNLVSLISNMKKED